MWLHPNELVFNKLKTLFNLTESTEQHTQRNIIWSDEAEIAQLLANDCTISLLTPHIQKHLFIKISIYKKI